jgi:hypothetical protein
MEFFSRKAASLSGDSWNRSSALKNLSSTSPLYVGTRKMWVCGILLPRAYMQTKSGFNAFIIFSATIYCHPKEAGILLLGELMPPGHVSLGNDQAVPF